jgi:hypothetical protein
MPNPTNCSVSQFYSVTTGAAKHAVRQPSWKFTTFNLAAVWATM